jgi:hypothetical protein
VTSAIASLDLVYLGWSGFRVSWPGGPEVFVDPPDAGAVPRDREAWILLTHGHPEHVQGTASHFADARRSAPTAVVASPRVCRHLRRRFGRANDRFHAARPGDAISFPGLGIEVFGWRHMPLLPPEPGLAVRHVARLARHPGLALAIVRDSLVGPPPGAMLGFRLLPSRGPRVLLYAEGLHRRTALAEAREAAQRREAEVLLFAVEPEDAEVLPDLVAAVGGRIVVPYEAHRTWRDDLGMPQADLERLASDLAARGVRTRRIVSGERLHLSEADLNR